MNEVRLDHLKHFYSILAMLEQNIGGAKRLADCSGRMDWPKRGVYFFRETGEKRSDTGTGPRIVRVGTHALKAGGSCGAACPHTEDSCEAEAGTTSARYSV